MLYGMYVVGMRYMVGICAGYDWSHISGLVTQQSVCIPLLLSTVHSTHAMLVLRTLIIHNVRMLRDAAHDDDDDDDKGPEGCSSWLVEDVRACLSIAHGVLYYGGDAAIGMLSRDNVLLEYVEEAAQEAALHDAARGVARALTKAK